MADWRIGLRVKQKYSRPKLRSDGSYVELPQGEVIDVVTVPGHDERLVILLDDGRQHIDDPDNWMTA